MRYEKRRMTDTYIDKFQDMVMGVHLEESKIRWCIVLRIPPAPHRMADMIEGGHSAIK